MSGLDYDICNPVKETPLNGSLQVRLELGRQVGCPGRVRQGDGLCLGGVREVSLRMKHLYWGLRDELVKWNWEVRMEEEGDVDREKEDMIEKNQQI